MQHEPQIGTVADLASRARLTRNPQGLAPITFLIGAGCSVSAGIPAVTTIAKDEVIRLAHKLTGKTQNDPAKALIAVANSGYLKGHLEIARNSPEQLDWGSIYDTLFAEVHTSPSEVSRVFKKIIKEANPKINWAHLALGELARLKWIATTITTNFDLLALEGYARAGVIPVVSDGLESLDRIDPKPDHPQLLQINGSVHSYRLRNSPADLDKVSASSSAITCFRNLFQASNLLVVVGYEGREPQIMKLLIDASETFRDKHIYWCLHSSDPAKLSPRAAEFLSLSANARLIPGQDADLFFHNVSTELGIGAPQAFGDPLGFLEQRLEGVYPADNPEHITIRSDISGLRDRITRLRTYEATLLVPDPKPKPAILRRRSTPKTAEALIAKLKLDHPDNPTALFDALDKAYDDRFKSGREKGIARDLRSAITLAKAQRDLSSTPDEFGLALNNLGVALSTLGERGFGTAQVEEAVAAFTEALDKYPRNRAPLNWAVTKTNLGNALTVLGKLEKRKAGTARIKAAVAAYNDALQEVTRDRVPLQWATTKLNLGTALQSLGNREEGTEQLEAAAVAYKEALLEYSRDRVPLHWATTMCNLANLEIAFFDKTKDAANLEKARTNVTAAREVLVAAGADHFIGLADRLLSMIDARSALMVGLHSQPITKSLTTTPKPL